LRASWRESDRLVPRVVVRPVLQFMADEGAAATVMVVAALSALAWANSPWHATYERLWSTELTVRLGGLIDLHDLSMRGWVNDAAMALFFLLAGLEMKRQFVLGELRDRRAAALPVLAAIGGMVVPAFLYLAINHGRVGAHGWGVPVATDIAFALGIVTLAGPRVPVGAKVFILTLAVVDDIGGIVIIAVFYAQHLHVGWLVVASACVGLTVLLRRADVRSMVSYIALGGVCWLALHQAGVEAAIVGVVFGLLTPARPFHNPARFGVEARAMVDRIASSIDDGVISDSERDDNEIALERLARLAAETASPLERLEHRLGPWVNLAIVPAFAFANAGVRLGSGGLETRVVVGVVVGLVVGKAVGVVGCSWLAVRIGLGRLPAGTTWRHLTGIGVTAGIGFTVALFVSGLGFRDARLVSSAKAGVLLASATAGVIGFLVLRFAPEQTQDPEPGA
jgi:NhaA family Na+:H+ antiporter